MPLQGSGAISLSQIRDEMSPKNGSYSLRSLSETACFTTPDSMSEFYGYSLGFSVGWMVRAGGGGGGTGTDGGGGGGAGGSSSGYMTLYKNTTYPVSVGGGGGTGGGAQGQGGQGGYSAFNGQECYGGGGGGGWWAANGWPGTGTWGGGGGGGGGGHRGSGGSYLDTRGISWGNGFPGGASDFHRGGGGGGGTSAGQSTFGWGGGGEYHAEVDDTTGGGGGGGSTDNNDRCSWNSEPNGGSPNSSEGAGAGGGCQATAGPGGTGKGGGGGGGWGGSIPGKEGGSGMVKIVYSGGSRATDGNYWGSNTFHIYYGNTSMTTNC